MARSNNINHEEILANIDKDKVLELVVAGVSLAAPAAAAEIAVGASIGKLLVDIYAKRKEKSEAIVLAELRHVESYEQLSQDPEGLVAKAARFHQAALVGAAHKNLRLLARLMLGHKLEPGLTADLFLSYAGLLEALRADELIVLSAFLRAHRNTQAQVPPKENPNLMDVVVADLQGQLEPPVILALSTGLTRTGFLLQIGGYGGGAWLVTSILESLESSYQFLDVLADESAD